MTELSNQDAINAWASAHDHVDDFGDEGDFTRQQLLNPAIFALLGPVEGRKILDAGCGQGYLCRLLAQRGAIVTGVEPAEPWYRRAVERERREQLGITYLQQDLSNLTDPRGEFDTVVANMVLMDIPDDEAILHNCVLSLCTGGSLIFSLLHPCFEEPSAEWGQKGYVEVSEYLREHSRQQAFAPLFHRPLGHYLNLAIDEGCILRRIVEPGLDRSWSASGPAYERNTHVPSVIIIHAIKA